MPRVGSVQDGLTLGVVNYRDGFHCGWGGATVYSMAKSREATHRSTARKSCEAATFVVHWRCVI
jgi:hypothetical protein